MYFYKHNNKYLFSKKEYITLEKASESELENCSEMLYCLVELEPKRSRRSYCISEPSLLEHNEESLELLQLRKTKAYTLPQWLRDKISTRQIMAINTLYPNWHGCLNHKTPANWRINIVGLGDVGSTLLVGLKLLGNDKISQIGIFDIDQSKVVRWAFEGKQIFFPNQPQSPKILALNEEQLFDCDMFVFCVTVGIPSLDSKGVDVRMAQFEGNSKIVSLYAKKAREAGFKGIFAVVSDPVDLLCKKALIASNTNIEGEYDFQGLAPEQIRGYGLGVMHARAVYYAEQSKEMQHYIREGRAFGPHGEHLVIADSIENYSEDLSLQLTDKARKANLELREHGYKPYVAPALSSGAIALMDTISGNWHYSATYMGGVYIGARNQMLESGTVLEQYDIPEQLMKRLLSSYKELESII